MRAAKQPRRAWYAFRYAISLSAGRSGLAFEEAAFGYGSSPSILDTSPRIIGPEREMMVR